MLKNFNPTENKIKIQCEGSTSVLLEDLVDMQGELKSLTNENRDRLAVSILKLGFIAPIFVWLNPDGERKIMDGHQRVTTLTWLKSKGWSIPKLPVAVIYAATENDAREKLIQITSQYGDINLDVLDDWFKNLGEELADHSRILELDLSEVMAEMGQNIGNFKPNLEPGKDTKLVDDKDVGKATAKLSREGDQKQVITVEAICPECGHEFSFTGE